MRLQLHALAYNLGNFMRTLAMPKAAEPGSLTSGANLTLGTRLLFRGLRPYRGATVGERKGFGAFLEIDDFAPALKAAAPR